MFLAFKNFRNRSRRTPNSSWAVPINTVLVSDSHVFPESGGNQSVVCFGDASRPTSLDIDVVSQVPTMFKVRATCGNANRFETTYIMCSTTVRHYKFRCPKSTDFGENATWYVDSAGPLSYSCVARFSRRQPVLRQDPPKQVVAESLNVHNVERNWRSNLVAK